MATRGARGAAGELSARLCSWPNAALATLPSLCERLRSGRYLTNLSLVSATHVRESLCWVGPHTVSLMVEFGAGVLVLLSAGIFLAHTVAAYRTE
jgi:hypothetical protein